MVVGFCFIGGLMLLQVMSVGFDETCTVSGKSNVSRVILRLYGWVYKTLRLSPLVVDHRVVVMSARLNPRVANFRCLFCEICVLNQWGHKILRPS